MNPTAAIDLPRLIGRSVKINEPISCCVDWVAASVDLLLALRGAGCRLRDLQMINGIEDGSMVLDFARLLASHFFGSSLQVAEEAGKGRFYTWRVKLLDGEGRYAGLVEFGGTHTLRKDGRYTARLELTGDGCRVYEGVDSSDHAQRWLMLSSLIGAADGRLSRVDLAADDFQGHYPLAWVISQYDNGAFESRGQNPKAKHINDYGSGEGSTFYVGRRTSEKMLRCYEKGKELGDPDSPWVRYEVQFKGSSRANLPLEMLTECAAYIKGAYPVLSFVEGIAERLRITREEVAATCKRAVRVFRHQYGPFANALLRASEGCERTLWGMVQNLSRTKAAKFIKGGNFGEFRSVVLGGRDCVLQC